MLSINGIITFAAVAVLPVFGQGSVSQARPDGSVLALPFDLSQVQLTPSRWMDNQNRSLNYLKFINVDRMLYVFRSNHKLSTNGAQTNGGWDAPSFPFRSHMQGHLLTAWAQCYATLKDPECLSRAKTMTAEFAKCQANNQAAGFQTGYLSGFPESEFDKLEQGKLTSGNVPYYCVHKTMAGLLDVWRYTGDQNAKTVLLNLAAWVDGRTSKLSTSQMQSLLGTEFGGMPEVLVDLYLMSNDGRWLTVAQRFHHESILNPLASGQDQLNGQHANTNMPKFIAAIREFKATGVQRYKDIGSNAWNIIYKTRTYAMGGTSQSEHWHGANQIAGYLKTDTAETCPTYNFLKLTRELWTMSPSTVNYFDYYERGLMNLILGQQRPSDPHGHITYFNSLNPGGKRGLGPAWGGGTWSTDYDSHWCCQGTGLESHTKLMDSIYFYDDAGLYVNLFTPSVLQYTPKGVTIKQTNNFPVQDTTTLTVSGNSSSPWAMRIRIPAWVAAAPTITVNGQAVSGLSTTAGTYATISRAWASGDVVQVKLPMAFRLGPANDNANLAAVLYGPVVLVGNYGTRTLSTAPTLALGSLKRTSTSSLAFTGTADGANVNLGPWYDAQEFNYVTYWTISGTLPSVSM